METMILEGQMLRSNDKMKRPVSADKFAKAQEIISSINFKHISIVERHFTKDLEIAIEKDTNFIPSHKFVSNPPHLHIL